VLSRLKRKNWYLGNQHEQAVFFVFITALQGFYIGACWVFPCASVFYQALLISPALLFCPGNEKHSQTIGKTVGDSITSHSHNFIYTSSKYWSVVTLKITYCFWTAMFEAYRSKKKIQGAMQTYKRKPNYNKLGNINRFYSVLFPWVLNLCQVSRKDFSVFPPPPRVRGARRAVNHSPPSKIEVRNEWR
jgi:hypothetical protein